MHKKIYVSVIVKHGITGAITPLSFAREDEYTYNIDKVLTRHQVENIVDGGLLWKYLCRVQGAEIDLFYDVEDRRWFIRSI